MNGSTTAVDRPTQGEGYMSPGQLAYFRQLLQGLRQELEFRNRRNRVGMPVEQPCPADPVDQGALAWEWDQLFQGRMRSQRMLAQVHAALARIENGSYGYCELTGEPIGLQRLLSQPLANLSIEAQEHLEQRRRLARANGLDFHPT